MTTGPTGTTGTTGTTGPTETQQPHRETTVNTDIDKTQTTTKTIKSFDIGMVMVLPFSRAIITINFNYESGESFSKALQMDSDNYEKWGDDDNILYEYVKSHIDELI
jgi:hypothetical protein